MVRNFQFILILSAVFIVVWVLVSYSFVRINRQTRSDKQAKAVQPAFRLADQWIMESQRKIEQLIESAEEPLGTAQHELLDLRLEAGRLPQGVKNLRTVRESLAGSIHPLALNQTLDQVVGLYLLPADFQVEESGFAYFQTDMGAVPVLEVTEAATLSDGNMKNWLSRLAAHANPATGGFLYFAAEDHFKVCQENKEWMEAIRNYRIMVLDFKGLTALLISLKLYHDTNRLIQTFQAGIQATVPLVGQADQMGAALASLGASALSAQTILDGGVPRLSITSGREGREVMSLKDWLTKTMYVTSPRDPDPFFRPRQYQKTKAEVVQAVHEVIAGLSQWKVEEYKEIQGRVRAVRWARPLPFADDINIYVTQGTDGITHLEMTGQTRVGKRDWGRNRRNIKEFLTKLDKKIFAS